MSYPKCSQEYLLIHELQISLSSSLNWYSNSDELLYILEMDLFAGVVIIFFVFLGDVVVVTFCAGAVVVWVVAWELWEDVVVRLDAVELVEDVVHVVVSFCKYHLGYVRDRINLKQTKCHRENVKIQSNVKFTTGNTVVELLSFEHFTIWVFATVIGRRDMW